MTQATRPDLSRCARALVVKPSSLGDIVHTLPAVRALRRRFPHLEISWLANPAFAPLLEGNPDVAETIAFPRESFRGPGGGIRFARWLGAFRRRHPRPDIALDFQGLLRSGLAARASGAPVVVGLSDSREGSRFLHSVRVPVDAAGHAVDRNLAMAAFLGADPAGPVEFPLPEGTLPAELAGAPAPPDAVLLHPYSRGAGKSLTAGQVVRLCEALAPRPVLVAGHLPDPPALTLPASACNLLNRTTLSELVGTMRRARAIVSVDSGPMHIAAALTPAVLAIHTWSDPRRTGPWRKDAAVWKDGRIFPSGDVDPAACKRAGAFPDSAVPDVVRWVESQR